MVRLCRRRRKPATEEHLIGPIWVATGGWFVLAKLLGLTIILSNSFSEQIDIMSLCSEKLPNIERINRVKFRSSSRYRTRSRSTLYIWNIVELRGARIL